MKKFKKIVDTTIIDELGNETKTQKVSLHTIKTWDELTREEKEKEIELRQEDIYNNYQENQYDIYKCELDNLKYEFKHITFDNIYLDSNSQGWWIDSIKNFKYHCDNLVVFGEELEIYDIDFKIRKLIETFDIDLYDYYIDSDKLDKIKKTKKYQQWINNIKKDIETWINRVNNICRDLGNSEYYSPYNLDNDNDKYFLDWYFEDMDFETIDFVGDDK